MLIAIDASTISTQGGPRTYVLGLITALLSIDRENEYIVFYNDPAHVGRFPAAREVVLNGKSPLARLWREHILLPLACRREGVDLLHCPKSAVPYFSPCPTVVTLHDLIPIRHPETEKAAARIYWRIQIPVAARRSSFVITDSEHARGEILEDFNLPPEKVAAVMLGFDPLMTGERNIDKTETVRARYGLPENYILYVGTIQPRKNIISLIEAYNLLRQRREVAPKLVIVGRKGWLYDSLFERIKALGLSDEIIFTGFVPDEELPSIYDGAIIFAYLSLFEGFGLPPLEAMACGVPVIASNTTSIPEVVGDAALTVTPTDINSIVNAMETILESPELAERLKTKGLERVKLFSWEKCAQETLDIYKKTADSGKRGC